MPNNYLTKRQQNFAVNVTEARSLSDAYRESYSTKRMSCKTVWEAASRLSKNPKVAARILELETEKEAMWRVQALSREDRVLTELEKIACGDGPASGRLKALELLGKHVGLFTTK